MDYIAKIIEAIQVLLNAYQNNDKDKITITIEPILIRALLNSIYRQHTIDFNNMTLTSFWNMKNELIDFENIKKGLKKLVGDE